MRSYGGPFIPAEEVKSPSKQEYSRPLGIAGQGIFWEELLKCSSKIHFSVGNLWQQGGEFILQHLRAEEAYRLHQIRIRF